MSLETYSVRVHWTKEDDWSSTVTAETPGEALDVACQRIAVRSGETEEFLREKAQFTVVRR